MKSINVILILILLLFNSCGNKDRNLISKPEKLPPLDVLYKNAYQLYEQNKFSESIKLFKKVETRYSFSEWAPKATLMILYMYYESNDEVSTLEYANKFQKLYPTSKNLDYVNYIMALVFYENIGVVSRDQTYAKEALKRFNFILDNYPASEYAIDIKYKIDLVNEQLAGKEMYLARYYMEKSRWIAALKRLNNIIENYDTTIYSREALHRLVEIYYRLGNFKEARKYASILGYNYNESSWYKKTYKIVEDKNYNFEVRKDNNKLRDKLKNFFKFSK